MAESNFSTRASSQYLDPRAAQARAYESSGKERAIKAAKEMQAIVEREVNKSGIADPQYEFLELIGKGAFGRVYKSKYKPTNQLVAVKIIDIDAADFRSKGEDTVKDVLRETAALRALKESHARNINLIYDAFFLASYVWIVSQYCPGGSVRTLMRATPEPGLKEAYIIPIARELAEALKWVHSAGIIHRDVKAANILICEDGRVQLCDFGVAGILESKINKRSTILGTPHYMAPEILDVMEGPVGVEYGNEVDIWAFGCTLYELATGLPPNARVPHEHLRFVVQDQVPRLEGSKYSAGLQSLVTFCIERSPRNRPTIEMVQDHSYISNTTSRYPTSTLTRLLYDYYEWEKSGGQRASLFMPGGAPMTEFSEEQDEDWNFSTTEVFDNSLAAIQSAPRQSLSRSTSTSQRGEAHPRIPPNPLERLFDPVDSYNYLERGQGVTMAPSDLPLREHNENSTRRETLIDAGAFDASTGIATIPDLATIRGRQRFSRFLRDSDDESEETVKFQGGDDSARRATKDWKFPQATLNDEDDESRRKTQDWTFPVMNANKGGDVGGSSLSVEGQSGVQPRPGLVHAQTAPTGVPSLATYDEDDNMANSPHSTIDLDDYISRPAMDPSASGSSAEHRSSLDGLIRHHGSEHAGVEVDEGGTINSRRTTGPRGNDERVNPPAVDAVQNALRDWAGMSEEEREEREASMERDEWRKLNAHPFFSEFGLSSDPDSGEGLSGSAYGAEDGGDDQQRQPRQQQRMGEEGRRYHGQRDRVVDQAEEGDGHRQARPGLAEETESGGEDELDGNEEDESSEDQGGEDEEFLAQLGPLFQSGPLALPPAPAGFLEGLSDADLAREFRQSLGAFHDALGTLRTSLETSLNRSQTRKAKRAAKKAAKRKAKRAAERQAAKVEKAEKKAAEAAAAAATAADTTTAATTATTATATATMGNTKGGGVEGGESKGKEHRKGHAKGTDGGSWSSTQSDGTLTGGGTTNTNPTGGIGTAAMIKDTDATEPSSSGKDAIE